MTDTSGQTHNGDAPLRVAIQGVAGCYHDAAARNFFAGREVTPVACDTFPALFDTLAADASMLGIVAIENTIAGSLLANHELLRQSRLTIIGEHRMRISHVLAALPGQTLDELYEVNSHPMALMQCEQWLRHHPHLKMVERFDTAGSAREIAENALTGRRTLCGSYTPQARQTSSHTICRICCSLSVPQAYTAASFPPSISVCDKAAPSHCRHTPPACSHTTF
ncbi:MAG: hypothetical protein K2M76_03645 [Muribaculaceae bacterium]|nr:hypothetical protein [Muribaculaceae bacterium]